MATCPKKYQILLLLIVFAIGISQLSARTSYDDRARRLGTKIDEEEGLKVLTAFQNQRPIGGTYFQFEMHSLPRRRGEGAKVSYKGAMVTRWLKDGLAIRMEIVPLASENQPLVSEQPTLFLSHNGLSPKVWRYAPHLDSQKSQGPVAIKDTELLQPLMPSLDFTALDLQMGFIFWPNYTYEGRQKSRRAIHSFLMHPPPELSEALSQISGIRIMIDERFNSLSKVELLDSNGAVQKSWHLRQFKKVGGQYTIKEIDYFNEINRRKTRFSVKKAYTDLALPSSLFQIESLNSARIQ